MSPDIWLYSEVDLGGQETEHLHVFDANVTHNLNKMAEACKLYPLAKIGISR